MLAYSLQRIGASLVLALVVSFATFALMFSNGTAIARAILGVDATDAQVQAKALELGLDQPVVTQYLQWLGGVFRGDLGVSYYTAEPVTAVLTARMPVTLSLVTIAMIATAVLAALLGVLAAVSRGWVDRSVQFLSLIGTAVPSFIVAIALVMWLAVSARIFPATGYVPFESDPVGWILCLVLPVTAVVVNSVGSASQQFRGAVKDVLSRDFVRTLRARGVSEKAIVFRNVLRNAAGPGIIILGLQIIILMGGVVVIERVFALPGIGNLTVSSSLLADIPVVMGCVLFIIVVVVVVNLVADLLNAALNPKVRHR